MFMGLISCVNCIHYIDNRCQIYNKERDRCLNDCFRDYFQFYEEHRKQKGNNQNNQNSQFKQPKKREKRNNLRYALFDYIVEYHCDNKEKSDVLKAKRDFANRNNIILEDLENFLNYGKINQKIIDAVCKLLQPTTDELEYWKKYYFKENNDSKEG